MRSPGQYNSGHQRRLKRQQRRRLYLAESLESRRLLAAAGDPDPFFGQDGIAVASLGLGIGGLATSLAMLEDGTAYIAGGLAGDFGVAHINREGEVDPSFGTNGIVRTHVGSSSDIIKAIVIQPDGKIVVGGYGLPPPGNTNFTLARYQVNGSLDTSFGTNGFASAAFAQQDLLEHLLIQPDGKIVALGSSYNGNKTRAVMARFHPNGSLDTTAVTDLSPGFGGIGGDFQSGLVLPDGKILAVGTSWYGTPYGPDKLTLARYLPNGSLDSSFGSGGIVRSEAASYGAAITHAPQGGYYVYAHRSRPLIARFSTDGVLDLSFGQGGIRQLGNFEGAYDADIAVAPDGKVVASFGTFTPGQHGWGVARVLPDGQLDLSFGENGATTTTTAYDSGGGGLVILSDGRPMTVGPNASGLLVARYRAVAPTFGTALANDSLRITGDAASNEVLVQTQDEALNIFLDGQPFVFSSSAVQRIEFDLLGGGDVIEFTGGARRGAAVLAGGNDSVVIDAAGLTEGLLRLMGGDGSDSVILAAGAMTSVSFDGGAGTDSIQLSGTDAADSVNIAAGIVTGLSGPLSFDNVEAATLNTLGGDDTVTLNDPGAAVTASMGPGNDSLNVPVGTTNRPVSAMGGAGDDVLNVTVVNYTSVTFDGGDGADSIVISDSRPSNTWSIYSTSVQAYIGFTLNHSSVSALTVLANANDDLFSLSGASQGMELTLRGGGGNDQYNLGGTQLPSSGRLILDGQAGSSDRVYYADGPTGTNYDISATSVVRQDGRGFEMESIELLSFQTSNGADTISAHDLAGISYLTLGTGGGDDRVLIRSGDASGLNLGISTGTGVDLVEIDERDATAAFTYTLNDSGLTRPGLASNGSAFAEKLVLTGTDQSDRFNIATGYSLSSLEVHGAAGDDIFAPGSGGNLATIRLPVSVFGGAGQNKLLLDNSASSFAVTAHLTGSAAGALPGDNLFGIGGSISYVDVSSVRVDLGGGINGDKVFVLPAAETDLELHGNDPAANPNGDTLHIALAAALDPVFTPGEPGAGTYTFSNRRPVQFTGFENRFEDALAPQVLAAAFDVDATRQTLRISFSEDVSGVLRASTLRLANLTTGTFAPAGSIRLAYDATLNIAAFDFPGFAAGILPDGDYRVTLPADAVVDAGGNPLPGDFNFDFFFLQGDATRDRIVNLRDFDILAANYQRQDAVFTQGDFNYDEVVNLLDFNILFGQFGKALNLPGSGAVPRSGGPHAGPHNDPEDLLHQLLA